MTQGPLILLIDDSPTIRKMVECHLSQAGYRVALAADAERGLELAATIEPSLILLDHQLPGTTGDLVCKKLLADEATARIPVVVSSSLRHKAFAHYAEFANVIDQIPKPFTPELLKSGVANALETGALVVQAQRTGCTMPESVGGEVESALSGDATGFPTRAVLDFLNNLQKDGRFTVELGKDRIRFALSAGRIQAVYSPTVQPESLIDLLPPDLADLSPLLAFTLGETQDASASGLVKLLERSLSDPRRLRSLLRIQSGLLTWRTLTGDAAGFVFEPGAPLPPMFQAFPLQHSLAALAVEGARYAASLEAKEAMSPVMFARQAVRGGNVDRAGLAPADLKLHALLEGSETLESVARRAGIPILEAAAVVLGLEQAGQVERRAPAEGDAVLLLEDDLESARISIQALGPAGEGCRLRHVRERVAAQLLIRRQSFSVVLLPIDRPEDETFYQSVREQAQANTRFVGVVHIEDEGQLDRLDSLGLDGVVHRPVRESDLRSTVRQLLAGREHALAT